MKNITRNFAIRAIKFVAFWLIVGLLLYLIGHYIYLFIPFILAFILTIAVNPLKQFLHRRFNIPMGLAVIVAMILEVGSFSIIVSLLVNRVINEIKDLYVQWPHYSGMLANGIAHLEQKVEMAFLQLPENYAGAFNVFQMLNDSFQSSMESISTLFSVPILLKKSVTIAALVPEMIIVIVIALVSTYFMAKGTQRYLRQILNIFPREWHAHIAELGGDFSKAFIGFVKAELIVFLITMVMCIAGLMLLGTKYAIVLGVISGIFGILPVLGVGIVLVPWAIIAFLMNQTFLAFGLLILTAVISIMRHIVEPKILGDNVGLDPLLVLISMYIGLAATGIIGLILGPFIVIAYQSLRKAGVFHNL